MTKIFLVIAALLSLVACSSAARLTESVSVPSDDMIVEESQMDMAGAAEMPAEVESNLPNVLESETVVLQDRKIIRNAELAIEVEDVIETLNLATALSTRFGGYTASTNTWTQGDQPYAQIRFAVPVERFETAMEQTRGLGKVKSESITSQDVTGQYVDIEARIANLEATAERIRGFLDDAKKVEDALNVNRELSIIEERLEVLKGQRNLLTQQTSFSTISLEIRPIPSIVPNRESTWSPVRTFYVALDALLEMARLAVDVAIWAIMLGGPVVLFFILLGLGVRWLFRLTRRSAS